MFGNAQSCSSTPCASAQAFSAAGFEHSIANMYLLSFALFTKFRAGGDFGEMIGRAPSAFPHLKLQGALTNLLWVTLGNMIGGITHWFIYLRETATKARAPR
jgi:formate transporter